MNAHVLMEAAKPCHAEHIVKARTLAKAAADYASLVERRNGQFTGMVEFERWKLCNAIIDLIDDGDANAERENLQHDLGIDDNGDPLRPIGSEFDASARHPDFPGGW